MRLVRALMIGDVVGEPGLESLERLLPVLIRETSADFVVVNGENAAEGFGITEAALKRIIAAGADAVTSGNHVWEKREFWPVMELEGRVLRPANYPAPAAGRGWTRIVKAPRSGGEADRAPPVSWLVLNLQGREFLPPIDCPFRTFDAVFNSGGQNASENHPLLNLDRQDSGAGGPESIVLVDFHAESPREKEALGYYLDGRASLVAGTHTHVQTSDERILPGGTAYITDLGMSGVTGGVIGMDPEICLNRARRQVLYRMECAKPGPEGRCIQGILAEIDRETGKAASVTRINRRESPGV